MEKISQVRSLQVLLARQKASLDAYFLVGDTQELERFDELSGIIQSRVKDMEAAMPGDPQVKLLQGHYDKILEAIRNVITFYEEDKTKAFAAATDDLLPKVQTFFDSVNRVESQIGKEVLETQKRMKQLVHWGGQATLVLGFLGALAGFLFIFSTYRSLSRSLKTLQKGTAAFGEGNWDFRIDLPARNELGELARSFNQMADDIKHLEMQTVHMHRMSAVGQLAGGVAHEINNPLTGVLGQSQLLLQKMTPEDPRRAHIEKIERAAQRCKRIVRSLLDFSRQKETTFSYVNINEAVDATLELCEPDLQGGRVAVIKDFSSAIPAITGNGSQLQQVFLNLVSNAIQAMPEGGTLTISTQVASFVSPSSADQKSEEAVEARFTDTGVGIQTQHLNHVFEPFFTTKEIGKGTGLGLSVSLGIVRNHGGDIKVESAGAGRGATFRVLLPAAGKAVPGIGIPAPASEAAGAGSPLEPRFGNSAGTRY
ncbi:MAG: HAMP domain-containing histidine kinase [Elusimicrobia bacterium]|nr:HAMP domain-containing histidine kinase [Elusimicrobiota bacterium]